MKGLLAATAVADDPPELLLGNFDREADTRLWEAAGKTGRTFEPRDPTDLNQACKVVLEGGSHGGIHSYRQPKVWSGYEVLSFVVWSPDRRGLGVRVDDENSKNYSTRTNGDVTLEQGRNLALDLKGEATAEIRATDVLTGAAAVDSR